jgi:hypothetical protein
VFIPCLGQTGRHQLVILIVCALAGLCVSGVTSGAWAATLWDTYIPPELAYADHLRQKVTVPAKININRGSLNQLKLLPGFNEEIALKVMRNRPFEDVKDFYRKLPGLDKKQVDRLIQQVQPKLQFQ